MRSAGRRGCRIRVRRCENRLVFHPGAGFAVACCGLIAACGSGGQTSSTPAPSSQGCTLTSARDVRQDFITNSTFDVTCAKVKTAVQFFFIDQDDAQHTVTTAPGDPESFDAVLPHKNSAFAYTFKKAGTYHIHCKLHGEKMTLIVF
jgi:plastocyanin